MFGWLHKKHTFYNDRKEEFKTGKLDLFVTMVVFVIFIWAFFIDSWVPLRNETGDIMYDNQGNSLLKLNLQVFIAPIILCYEMLLLLLEGKKRGRYIKWWFYYRLLEYKILLKLREGKELTIEYYERSNH